MPNVTPSFSQAVEAAKRIITGRSGRKDGLYGGGTYRIEDDAATVANAILSAPGPSRDPATAEKCREFVRKCMTEGLKMLSVTTDMQSEHADKTIDRLAAELLAMFAGGAGDDECDRCGGSGVTNYTDLPGGAFKLNAGVKCPKCNATGRIPSNTAKGE